MRSARRVEVGSVPMGGGAPVSLQSMTKTDTRDVEATLAQIRELEQAGCDLVRVAIPDEEAARAFARIRHGTQVPLIADIHFDHRLALIALESGVDKLRLNPGNIRKPEQVRAVVRVAHERRVPIRVGANLGSLPPDVRAKHRNALHEPQGAAQALFEAAMQHVRILEDLGFGHIVLSLKAFDVPTAIGAYRLAARETDYPLHLGVTEAGPPPAGTVRSAVGIGALLAEGIGDTIRVSLSAPPLEEVRVGREILRVLALRPGGVTIVSCPTCSRCGMDVQAAAHEVERSLRSLDDRLRREARELRVAVMGCAVNGPGEARDADVGIAADSRGAVLFSRGEVVGRLDPDQAVATLVAEAERLAGEPVQP
ncbi:MAG: flavodoxin-dependent (E)-4-hydroxy-3-methylbut-2-enyl-diphosphate synthase [Armatimonadota bacterium]|nr:MAG: flavodoxin-dependent (E)-4-hydroxy-3-methylbut-2-enyl-diphosphate synthase [Armatimonadota bacterium]